MAKNYYNFHSIVGRFVYGDHENLRTTDHTGATKEFDKQQIEIGMAFDKAGFWASPMFTGLWAFLGAEWVSEPDALARLNAWGAQPGLAGKHGGLSLKISDGDKPNNEGNLNPNTAGCYVVYLTTGGMGANAKPPAIVGGSDANSLVQLDLSDVKRGDYGAIAGSVCLNGRSGDQAGIFMNLDTFWLTQAGDAILTGQDPTKAFGGSTITSTHDTSNGAGAGFGAATPPPGVSAPAATVHAATPPGLQPSAQGGTVSAGNTTPHTDILNPTAVAGTPPAPGSSTGTPPAPGMPPAPGA